LTDSARNRAAAQLYQFASSQSKYPSNTLRAGIDGIIYVRLTIAGDGTVSQAEITRRILSAEGGDSGYVEKGKAALDAEVVRVAQALRFQPSSSEIDTVTISQRFLMQ
jgi:TonB family protein